MMHLIAQHPDGTPCNGWVTSGDTFEITQDTLLIDGTPLMIPEGINAQGQEVVTQVITHEDGKGCHVPPTY